MTHKASTAMTSAKAPKTIAMTRRLILLLLMLLGFAPAAWAQSYTITPTPYQTAFDNSGRIISNSCIWTYAAGTTNAATTFADNVGTPNSNPIRSDSAGRFTAFLAGGNSYKFVYEAACTPPSHGTTLRTADNIQAVPNSSLNVDVQGTAGENLSLNEVVFLSDGSRGNTAGLWYRARADFQDSSINALTIGMAPAAIGSGVTGTIRIQGRMTGLSGLSASTPSFFVATSPGQLTSTAPLLARYVGDADSTTSLVLVPNPRKALVSPGDLKSCGRLTLTTATPVTTGDVTAATSIFFTPDGCDRIALYDGVSVWNTRIFPELTLSLSSCTASKPYDVFVWDNAGVPTLEDLVWTSTTARATALVLTNGVETKSGATTRRFVGSFFCNATGGQTDDSAKKRNVCNMDNRVPRPLRVTESADSWTSGSAGWRQVNGNAADQVEVLECVGDAQLDLRASLVGFNSSGAFDWGTCIGAGSATTPAVGFNGCLIGGGTLASGLLASATLTTYPAVGWLNWTWLEYGHTSTPTTYEGDDGSPANAQSALSGSITQ